MVTDAEIKEKEKRIQTIEKAIHFKTVFTAVSTVVLLVIALLEKFLTGSFSASPAIIWIAIVVAMTMLTQMDIEEKRKLKDDLMLDELEQKVEELEQSTEKL